MTEGMESEFQNDDATYDSDYEAYMAQQAQEIDESIQLGSHTREYLILKQEIFLTSSSLNFIEKAFRHKKDLVGQEILRLKSSSNPNDIADELDLNHLLVIAEDGEKNIEYAYNRTSRLQRQLYFANLVNVFENYIIDIVKLLLLLYPSEIKSSIRQKLSQNISYQELIPSLNNQSQLSDYILNKLIEGAEREYKIRGALEIIGGFNGIVVGHEEYNALMVAIEIRHKITHRHGKTDLKFNDDVTNYKERLPQGSKYVDIGRANNPVGAVYLVLQKEFDLLRELVSNVSGQIDRVIASRYTKLIKLDPWDYQLEMREIEESIQDWEVFNK